MNFYLVNLISFFMLFYSIQLNSSVISERGLGVVQIPITGEQPLKLYSASYALLIGESNYTDWPSLENIPKELQQVEELLKSQGFQVIKKLNLDSVKLKQAFEDFINQYGLDSDNRLLFFFSGHGHTRKNGNKGYLVPTDAPNPEIDERGFIQKAVDMELVTTWARKIESKHALFLFDSCFSGTVFKAKGLPKIPKYIDRAIAKPTRQFISAGSADETVPAKSVFTPAFIDALREGKADLNHDGFVTGIELGAYLVGEVPKYTEQTPQFGKIKDYDLAQGDFVFAVDSAKEQISALLTPSQEISQIHHNSQPIINKDKRVALIIGNGDYRYISKFKNPKNDAQDLAESLRQLGFLVIYKADLDKQGMEQALQQFAQKLRGANLGLFFYSGMGIASRGHTLLAPITTNPAVSGEALLDEFITVDSILQVMKQTRIPSKIIILDTCLNDPFSNNLLEKRLAAMQSETTHNSTLIAYSTQPNNVAQDGVGRNSPYTENLLRFIKEPNVPIEVLFKKVAIAVSEQTKGQQIPWVSSTLLGENLCLAGCSATTK